MALMPIFCGLEVILIFVQSDILERLNEEVDVCPLENKRLQCPTSDSRR